MTPKKESPLARARAFFAVPGPVDPLMAAIVVTLICAATSGRVARSGATQSSAVRTAASGSPPGPGTINSR